MAQKIYNNMSAETDTGQDGRSAMRPPAERHRGIRHLTAKLPLLAHFDDRLGINMKIVSACLCGINCNYKGRSKPDKRVIGLVKSGKAIPICPEQLGGLATPRTPAEIRGGTGLDVLNGKAKVIDRNGRDVTQKFVNGAFEVLRIAKITGSTSAVLKARSPSCGFGRTYDGTFSGTSIDGDGVTAALLKRNGLKITTEEAYAQKAKR